MIALTREEEWLHEALKKLSKEHRAQLAEAIGKPNCDIVWFDEDDVVEKAAVWVEKTINESKEFDLPSGVLSVKSALKPFLKRMRDARQRDSEE